jgi:hypothetical protein
MSLSHRHPINQGTELFTDLPHSTLSKAHLSPSPNVPNPRQTLTSVSIILLFQEHYINGTIEDDAQYHFKVELVFSKSYSICNI